MNLNKLEEAPAAGIYEASASRHAVEPEVITRMKEGTSTDDIRCECQDCNCAHCKAKKHGRDPGISVCPCTQLAKEEQEAKKSNTSVFKQKVQQATEAAKNALRFE